MAAFPRPQPFQTLPRSFCSGCSLKKRPSATTSPSVHALFSPRRKTFCTFSSSSHPSEAGAAPRNHAREPHSVGPPCSCAPRRGSAGAWGAVATRPPSPPSSRDIHGQGETGPRGRGCTEELFIAQDGWLQVVWLRGTVAVILFIVCFQNLSKEKNNQKTKIKTKGSGFSSRGAKGCYLFDSFSPADLSTGANVKEIFISPALEGVWCGKSRS